MTPSGTLTVPRGILAVMVAGIFLVVVLMFAMLAIEVVILFQVFDLLDLVRRLVHPA